MKESIIEMNERKSISLLELALLPVIALPIIAWGNGIDWDFSRISALTLFPLFGLVSFSIMWWHYLVGFVRDINPKFEKLKSFTIGTSVTVFVLIILHPLLLALSNDRLSISDTFKFYVGEQNLIYLYFGVLSLLIFLAYDAGRMLKKQKWINRNWIVIDTLDDIAFGLVFIHGMYLGQHLQSGWLKWLWVLYGLSGAAFIIYKYYLRIAGRTDEIG